MIPTIDYVHIKNMYAHKDTVARFTSGKNYIVGPIGSGKTEILQAIAFAFFGTCALRDKASSYKDIFVELRFNYKDQAFLITRKIDDANISIDVNGTYEKLANSTTGVNQFIINLLGYNYDIFLLSNFCQQKKLSYFSSDLTPAKRLQYIDKISGIEEAKELTKYLTAKRKDLKNSINLLKGVTIEPKLSEGIDLTFDYESNIKVLSDKLSSINDMYSEYSRLVKLSSVVVKEPQLILTPLEQSLLSLTEDGKDACSDFFKNGPELQREIDIINQKIQDIPNIPSRYRNITLDEVKSLIRSYNLKSISEVAEVTDIVCPSCNTTHKLSDALDAPDLTLEVHNISHLHIVHDYLSNDSGAILEQLESDKRRLETLYANRVDRVPVNILSSIKTQNIFDRYLQTAEKKVEDFNKEYDNYLPQLEQIKTVQTQAEELKQTIDKYMEEQSSDLSLKDTYTKALTERDLYLHHFSLYSQAKEKLDNFNIELDLVGNLLKQVADISLQVKQQTIPLINHHASTFLNSISKGTMSKIEITDTYELIVDGFKISVRSGGQQDLASLAFRLSLGRSVISGMLPLFLADEIDSAGGEETSNDIIEALDAISNFGFQIIMVTHKDTSNLENVNIIQL